MATSSASGHKSPMIINKLSDIDFQAEVEIICNYLRWESFPKRSTENFKSILERRAQTFCVEEYVPTDADDASSALSVALQLFYTGSAGSSGDDHVEDPVKAAELPQVDGCKRLVISHPRLQLNILNTVHTGQEGSNTHLSLHDMWKKIIPVYFWRNIGTSIIEFIKNCEMCKLQDEGPKTDLPTAPLTSTSNSENGSSRDTEMEMEDDHDDSFESFQLSDEVPYHEEVSQIYDYLKTGKYPPNGTPNFKRGLRRKAQQYMLAEDDTDGTNKGLSKKLYYLKAQERKANQNVGNGSKRGVEVYTRLVVSMPEEQQKILQIAHIGASGEHCGRDKMVDSLTKLYFWKGLYRSVMVFLENCSECQTKRTHPQTRSFEQSVPKQDVWETPRAREAAKGITLEQPPEVKPKPPIPQELTELPKGLSHISGLDTEVEALVLYLYLKWQKYPPECTDGFKRTVRKKANAFFVHEESGVDYKNNWCLYYKGDLNKDPRDTGQVVEAEEITGDVKSKDSAAPRAVGELEETDQTVEIAGSKETEDTRETDGVLQTLEIKGGEVTEAMDSAVTTKSKVIRKERSVDYRTRHKLYVYRKPDQQKILQYVHLHGGRNGRHAGRDKVSSVISRHFFWRGYKDDILMILTKCKICQMKRTANRGVEYNLYLQKLDRDGIQNGYEDAFEDHSTHKLPLKLQAYLENAMSMEAGWEAEDLSSRRGPLPNLNSSGDQTVHCQEGEGATEQVRLTEGVLSSFTYHRCGSCPQRFRDRDSLQYQKLEKHINRTSIKCTLCTKVFKRSEDLSAHMRCHTKEKPYECEYCKKPFRYRSGLTHHRKLHFGFKPFACPECPLRFVSRGDLNMHFKSAHEGRGDYLCDICGKSFATPVRLKMHKKIHMESRQRFICNICGKVLATSTTFKYHMYIHTGERHILCELCGKGFKKKDELNKHMRCHMGIKPYQCHICQRRFSLKGDLRDHIRGHEGASLYQCEVCDKRFKNKRSMARCKRKHTQAPTEEGFQCNTCGEVLGTLIDFALHMEAHVGAQIIRQEVVIE